MLRVARFTSLGFAMLDYRIHVHDLPEYGVYGLLGADTIAVTRVELESASTDQTCATVWGRAVRLTKANAANAEKSDEGGSNDGN